MKNKIIKVIKANKSSSKSKDATKESVNQSGEKATTHKMAENINSWIEESRRQKENLRRLALKQFGSLNRETSLDFA